MYTWCAWDSLFIPEIIDKEAHAESICPESGQTISLTIVPSRIARREPPDPVLSFVLPEAPELRDDVRGSFCEHVHFFASRQAGESWVQRLNGLILITLDEAFELGIRKNDAQFGNLLGVSMQLDSR